MTFLLFSISFVIIFFSTAATVSGWEHRGPIVAREEPREYAAWYQMPQGVAAYPPNAYERAVAASAAASQYAGYPRPYSRSPDYYPETAVTNNMVPSSRKAGAAGYYIPGQNPQDVSFHPPPPPPHHHHPISKSFPSQSTVSPPLSTVTTIGNLLPSSSSQQIRAPIVSSGILPYSTNYLLPPQKSFIFASENSTPTNLLQYPTINIRQALLRRYPTMSSSTSLPPPNIYRSNPYTTTTTTVPLAITSPTLSSSEFISSEYIGRLRERAADLRSLSSLLRKTAVTRSPTALKLSPPQMEKLMDDQINAFVGVVRKLYEWKDWIWWGSMKYLDLAKKRV